MLVAQGKLPGYAQEEEVKGGVETPQRRLYVDLEGGHRWAYQPGNIQACVCVSLSLSFGLPARQHPR
jgi:hypothetical protein